MRKILLLKETGRILFFLFLLIAAAEASAQDYAPVRVGDTAYFEYSNYYRAVEAIAIASVEVDGNDSIFIPFKQIRPNGNCYNINGEHWLGKIVKKPKGEYLFVLAEKDTFRILSSARKGDSWIFKSDTAKSDTAYLVDEISTKILGFKDSIKVISIGQTGIEIWLSKRYGIVQFPVTQTFPQLFNTFHNYPRTGIMKMVEHSRINRSKYFINFNMIYDINVGDEIHTIRKSLNSHRQTQEIYYDHTTKEIKTCIDRIEVADTIWIKWKRRSEYYGRDHNPEYKLKIWDDTLEEKFVNVPYMNSLPGQTTFSSNQTVYNIFMNSRYRSEINNRVRLSVPELNEVFNSFWGGPDSCMRNAIHDGCYNDEHYYIGLGGPYYFCNNFPLQEYSYNLIYFKKGSETWGIPLHIWAVGEKEPEESLQVTISPNPATEKVYIALEGAAGTGIDRVQVVNLQGKTLYSQQEKSSQNVQLNVSELAAGIYLVKIYSGERTAFKKIVITK